jgi:hypothetical protein
MSWKDEHGAEFDVPALIQYMVKKKMLEDQSWHNDTMPRFAIIDPEDDETGALIWVDHPIGHEREAGPGPRFMVHGGEVSSDPMDQFETDDLEKALETLFEYAEKHIPKWKPLSLEGLIKDWIKSTR